MAPHTVALQGHTGRIGGAAFKSLLPGHAAGKYKLVVVHRPGSDLSAVPKDVETREVDFDTADEATIKEAIKGINVYISAVGITGLATQGKLYKPFSETPGFVTYVCPIFGNPLWTEDPQAIGDERIVNMLSVFDDVRSGAQRLGVGRTAIQSGVFSDYFIHPDLKYTAIDIRENFILLPSGGETKGMALSSPEGLGEAIAEVAARDPESIKNKDFYVYDYEPTGNQLIEIFTKLHGKAPQVKLETNEDYENILNSTTYVHVVSPAVYRHCWGTGVWRWRGERLGPQGKDFEPYAKTFFPGKSA